MDKDRYQICSRCIMDTNDDPEIIFNLEGHCNYCIAYKEIEIQNSLKDLDKLSNELNGVVREIKTAGKDNKYDCLLGVSGGIDSTYVALLVKKLGLRPLIVHYDNGWNSEIAVMNIENIVKKLNFDLYTYVNNWNEFKDIQLAFLKASVVDIELITDHAIIAVMNRIARKFNIKYIISGSNISTEAILPKHWHHWKTDALNITEIHKLFGKIAIPSYPTFTFWDQLMMRQFFKIKSVNLLNYIEYDKEKAKYEIINQIGWQDYGGKHYESIFTRFYQSYILPKKFHIDKRKAHLSSLICSNQITRENALLELKKPVYDELKMQDDYEYVIKKFDLTSREFENLLKLPPKKHLDYPSYFNSYYKYQERFSKFIKPLKKIVGK